ncbi:hypothetical protein [Neorhodopirellula pilleata]|uniref:Uncharacterized protein n=1 Tax=Neorhodopirellula pilleata TaxID=2714738 RepID=A0A5C6AYE9_9BACT|nr:hypothetical protein [Neorhodopirellula pilleata]TWU04006.1 hypothetical protein Pla100_09420 [Neorhodopirellula pilleata]
MRLQVDDAAIIGPFSRAGANCLPTRSKDRTSQRRRATGLPIGRGSRSIAAFAFGIVGFFYWIPTPQPTWGQSGYGTAPQTNLSPIGPTNQGAPFNSGGFSNPASGFPSASPFPSTAPSGLAPSGLAQTTNPSFDPYAVQPGGSMFGGASINPLAPSPYASGPTTFAPSGSNFGSPGTASLGSPVGGNPSYPNGSLLGGLFSGNWFRGNSNPTGVYQGAGYPTGALVPFGTPSASASTYSAPSIYGSAPPQGGFFGAPVGNATYGSPYAGDAFGGGVGDPFPASAYPSGSPTSLFPGGISGAGGFGSGGALFPGGLFPSGGIGGYQLLHGPRLRHTYISGGDGDDEVGLNQTDASIGFAFGNFFYSNRPLYVVPSFSLYLFDGPVTTAGSPADLPGNAYAGFIDFGWQTDPNQIIGGELGVRVGAYTDFDTFNDDSIRVMGKGLVSFRLTPASTLKAGVYYLDRQSIKLLPAGGLLWQPDPYTRFDIFFPEPKFAKYWRTIGTQDVWWYLAGEYGGDSWTVTRASNLEERVDINQIGVTFGFEWGRSDLIRTGQRRAFLEAGVVFDRELNYEVSPHDRDLNEAFMFRGGWGY